MRRSVTTSLALTWLVASATPALAQNEGQAAAAPAPAVSPPVYTRPLFPPNPFENLGTETGLPQAHVTDMVQDRDGFMWFSTVSGGVARYDGYQMKVLGRDIGPSDAIETMFTKMLEIDADGRLWIGTGDLGVIVYDPATNQVTKHRHRDGDDSSLASDGVAAMLRDGSGVMWVATSGGVLNRFDPATGNFQRVELGDVEGFEVMRLARGRGDHLWVGANVGLYKLDPASGAVIGRWLGGDEDDNLTGDEVRAVYEDEDGTVWVGTDAGLDRLDAGKRAFTRYRHVDGDRTTLSSDSITAIIEDSDGLLWVGTENGLNEMGPDRRAFTRYARDATDLLASEFYPVLVTSAYEDRGGVLWFGSRGGVRKLHPLRRKFNPYLYASVGGEVVAFTQGAGDTVWVGTYTSGLQKIDWKTATVTVYTYLGDPADPGALKLNNWISTVHRDKRGVLWLGGDALGLVRFDPRTGAHRQYLPSYGDVTGPSSDRLEKILSGPDGTMWLATWGGGLNKFDQRTGEFLDYIADPADPEALSSDHLYALHFDIRNPNVLWIGTARGGLNRFDTKTEKVKRYSLVPDEARQLEYDSVLCIHQSPDGKLWLGVDGGGLVRLDPDSGELEYFTADDGLPNPTIYGILEDDEGKLWMSTNGGGVAVLDPRTRAFTVYTAADGLLANEFIQNAYFRDSKGRMYFSSGGAQKGAGFNVFRPEEIAPDRYPPPIAVTGFQIFNRDVDLPQPIWTAPTLHLSYRQSVFSLEFAALSFGAPERTRYAYRMDGLHDWVETDRRFVTYTNLDGGDYVFRVRAANGHGVWSEETVAMTIEVDPPPWRTWWAYLMYALLGLAVVLGYLIYQARKVEALRTAHRLESVERELMLTGAVQTGFLPKSSRSEHGTVQLHGFYRAADKASGDWWWYEHDGTTLTVIVADVTGHGPAPAMVTAAAATAFRILADDEASGPEVRRDLERRIAMCHRAVVQVGRGEYPMTMSALQLNERTGRFVLYSAGGLPLMWLRRDGRPTVLPCPGTPLGNYGKLALGRAEGRLKPGERLMIYTDGIVETELDNGRMLGMRRLSQIFAQSGVLATTQAAESIAHVADTIRGSRPQQDDWTFVLIEWAGKAADDGKEATVPGRPAA